jgi:hypothetical protein
LKFSGNVTITQHVVKQIYSELSRIIRPIIIISTRRLPVATQRSTFCKNQINSSFFFSFNNLKIIAKKYLEWVKKNRRSIRKAKIVPRGSNPLTQILIRLRGRVVSAFRASRRRFDFCSSIDYITQFHVCPD